MWRSLYNRGDLKVEEQSDKGARIRLADFPSETAGCSRVTGWIERMAEMTGVKNIVVTQTQCAAKGGKDCEWTVTWT
jgi:predicted hydrocarbon binding protein